LIISIIAAMSENRVIGNRGKIPWNIPADRRRFRDLTMGHTVLMGRRTFEAIGRPLEGRRNIVLSRRAGYQASGCIVASTFGEALRICSDAEQVFICGGGGVYLEALPLAEDIYLTLVHMVCEGDAFFPPIPDCFVERERIEAGDGVSCTFIRYIRTEWTDHQDIETEK
jgi:dihydrofolate reductase